VVRTLAARVAGEPAPVGVLLVSMPVLNGPWRRLAWPGVFDGVPRDRRAAVLNHPRLGVRCISRVIVEPRFRGLGVATRLVRAYLRRPMTVHTEALAAMGEVARFFERAGMSRLDVPPSARHARLLDLLEQHRVPLGMLSTPGAALRLVRARVSPRVLARELRRWHGVHDRAGGSIPSIAVVFRRACRELLSRPAAFVHRRSEREKA
jgi:GNAT superfamily N-acetyltransferase